MSTDAPARRLLLLSCSARKKKPDGLVPAWELYDGVAFQVVKRVARERGLPTCTDLLILSALHGVIEPSTPIGYYDLRMTSAAAAAQRAMNLTRLRELTAGKTYGEIYLMMGRTYLEALSPTSEWGGRAQVIHHPKSIGLMLRELKMWLTAERGA
ncbi:MAG: DUF6884 domain-containing protein [Pyrinomonadaceae bacterium]